MSVRSKRGRWRWPRIRCRSSTPRRVSPIIRRAISTCFGSSATSTRRLGSHGGFDVLQVSGQIAGGAHGSGRRRADLCASCAASPASGRRSARRRFHLESRGHFHLGRVGTSRFDLRRPGAGGGLTCCCARTMRDGALALRFIAGAWLALCVFAADQAAGGGADPAVSRVCVRFVASAQRARVCGTAASASRPRCFSRFCLTLPFHPTANPSSSRWLYQKYNFGKNVYPYNSVNAFNLWSIAHPFWQAGLADDLGLAAVHLGHRARRRGRAC